MNDDEVLAVSGRGAAELQEAGTTLASADLDLLVRFDGSLTWDEVRAALPAHARDAATRRVGFLLASGLLERARPDPFGSRLQFDASMLAVGADARATPGGVAALRRRGFRAGIAMQRVARPAADGPRTIVLVEDDPMLAQFVRAFLALEGFDVRVAGHRAEIVEQIRRPPRPDLFLLDVQLPDTDGFTVLRSIRAHPALHDVPAIMLTAEGTREAVIRGLAGGADGYITKPVDPAALVRAVHAVLGSAAEGGPAAPGWSSGELPAGRTLHANRRLAPGVRT